MEVTVHITVNGNIFLKQGLQIVVVYIHIDKTYAGHNSACVIVNHKFSPLQYIQQNAVCGLRSDPVYSQQLTA